MFHEICGHAAQDEYEFQKQTSLSMILAMNHFACCASDNYYGIGKRMQPNGQIIHGGTEQYFRQPHEIAAQYAGIYCAYIFLSEKYSQEEANRLICSYTNNRVKNGTSYMETTKQYSDVHEILKDLDDFFQNSILRKREYMNQGFIDPLQYYSQRMNSTVEKETILNGNNGMLQDYQMSSVTFWQIDKEQYYQSWPVFKNINMSIQFAFKFPEQYLKNVDIEQNKPSLTKLTYAKDSRLAMTEETLRVIEEQSKQNYSL